jgi:hypothetical protein
MPIRDHLVSAVYTENSVFGGFEDGIICCWNFRVSAIHIIK